ncbi:hypothetical protein ACWD4O_25305 [Streptomyces sp. NPDC002623]
MVFRSHGSFDGAVPEEQTAADDFAAPAAVLDAQRWPSCRTDKASLTKAEAGVYEVTTPPKAEVAAADAVEVADDACLPLGRTFAGSAVGEPAATTHRRATGNASAEATPTTEEAAIDINTGVITLASYASADAAAAALKSVSDAVTACASGLRWTADGEETKATKITKDTAPAAGEEAVAFTAVTPLAGVDTRWKAVVFRSGVTLAHFTFANAGSLVSGGDFAFPAELVTAQAEKLA